MAPVEVELKDSWAIGLKPAERKVTVQPRARKELLTTHPHTSMIVECNPDDDGGFIKVGDDSLDAEIIEANQTSRTQYPSMQVVLKKGDTVKIRTTQSNKEVAIIKHIPRKDST